MRAEDQTRASNAEPTAILPTHVQIPARRAARRQLWRVLVEEIGLASSADRMVTSLMHAPAGECLRLEQVQEEAVVEEEEGRAGNVSSVANLVIGRTTVLILRVIAQKVEASPVPPLSPVHLSRSPSGVEGEAAGRLLDAV